MSFIEGFLIGLSTIIFIGPVLTLLIFHSINRGYKFGLTFALGIIISDILISILCYFGFNFTSNSLANVNYWFNILSSGLIFCMGLYYIFKKNKYYSIKTTSVNKNYLSVFIEGFSINFFNPFVFGFWLFFMNYGRTKYDLNLPIFIIGILLGIFCIDLLKIYSSKWLKKIIQSNKILILVKISGILLIFYSLRILYNMFM